MTLWMTLWLVIGWAKVQADTQTRLTESSCTLPPLFPKQILQAPDSRTTLSADRLSAPASQLLRLSGQVELRQPNLYVKADRIRLHQGEQSARAFGHLALQLPSLQATAQRLFVNQSQQTLRLSQLNYQLFDPAAQGQAEILKLNQTQQKMLLHHSSYSTCPQNKPEQVPAWELGLDELELNRQTRRAYGYNVWFKLYDWPVLYLPYLDFPLDSRASGFLFPTFGSYSTTTHREQESYFSLPYYIYLAPNRDATITLSHLKNRGLLLDMEARYLEKNHGAEWRASWLDDQVVAREGLAYLDNDTVTYHNGQSQRWQMALNAQQNWGVGWRSNLQWQSTSDHYYYQDLPFDSGLKYATHLSRSAELSYQNLNFSAQLTIQDYQPLGFDAPTLYQKRPGLWLHYDPTLGHSGWFYQIEAEGIEFTQNQSSANPVGIRTYLHPSLGYRAQAPWGHIELLGQLHQVNYQLNQPLDSSSQRQAQRTIPQIQLQAGLVFERSLGQSNQIWTQTLEPSAQYLYTPYIEQYQTPVFDTELNPLDFASLFASNRFSGYDRIGDTEQVSLALISQLFDSQGRPVIDMGVGQIVYLQDRKVDLTQNTPTALEASQTQNRSDYLLKLGWHFDRAYFALNSQHHYQTGTLQNLTSRLKLEPNPHWLYLVSGRIGEVDQANETKEIIQGLSWQINPNWQLGGYWHYDWHNELHKKRTLALRYDHCCWASELAVNQEEILPSLYNYGFNFMIEFKGLSSVGQPFKDFLTDKLNF